jgi:hypothetical protein
MVVIQHTSASHKSSPPTRQFLVKRNQSLYQSLAASSGKYGVNNVKRHSPDRTEQLRQVICLGPHRTSVDCKTAWICVVVQRVTKNKTVAAFITDI